MHRDTKRLKALAVAAVRRARKPGAEHRGRAWSTTASPVIAWAPREEVGRWLPLAGLRQPTLNLGMFVSTECNVRINLRSMVRRISLITLAG